MTKTIRLPEAEYRMTHDGHVQYFGVTSPSQNDWTIDGYAWMPTRYKMGARAVLVSCTDVSPNAIRSGRNTPKYYLCWDLEGVGGNSNPRVKRILGWRGTTNDKSVDAHGIVSIVRIRELKNGDVAVTVRS